MNRPLSPVANPAQWRWLAWAGLAGLIASTLVAPGSAQAQAPAQIGEGSEAADAAGVIEDYHYEAPAGSNLTYLVRRSLQYVDPTDAPYSAAQVATETCVVQALGADDLIFVGQAIVVEGQVIADCQQQTDELTEAQLDCWARYLPVIREDLDWITPTQVVAAAQLGADDSEAVGELPGDVAVAAGSDATDINLVGEAGEVGESGGSFSAWYWWVIAGFVLGLGWYFFVVGRSWRRDPAALVADQPEDKKVAQPEDISTPVDEAAPDQAAEESEPTSTKSKNRRRRSKKS